MTESRGQDRTEPRHVASGRARAERRSIRCLSTYENLAREQGYACIAGVDEVGRGALFGPVFAAAVVLESGSADSRTARQQGSGCRRPREDWPPRSKRKCVAWAVGAADAFEIDQINIYQASRLAMRRAVEALASARITC